MAMLTLQRHSESVKKSMSRGKSPRRGLSQNLSPDERQRIRDERIEQAKSRRAEMESLKYAKDLEEMVRYNMRDELRKIEHDRVQEAHRLVDLKFRRAKHWHLRLLLFRMLKKYAHMYEKAKERYYE